MLKEKFNLTDKVAFIVGSARGIGTAYAQGLAEYGAKIVIADINFEGAKKTALEIKSDFNIETLPLKIDVTSSKSIKVAINNTLKHFGKLDIAINNAGVGSTENAEEITDKKWDWLMSVNLKGVFMCCREEGKVMIKNRSGVIINTASMSASIVNIPQNQTLYNTSKAGVLTLTKCLAAEWTKYNIRVNCISPGYMSTEMNMREPVRKLHKAWCDLTPMKRLGDVDELKGALVYLASNASTFTTGLNLIVDGGYVLW